MKTVEAWVDRQTHDPIQFFLDVSICETEAFWLELHLYPENIPCIFFMGRKTGTMLCCAMINSYMSVI